MRRRAFSLVCWRISPITFWRWTYPGRGDRAELTAIRRERGVRAANIMETEPESAGPWDLVVMSGTIYYAGWLYSFFDVDWLARRLFATVHRWRTVSDGQHVRRLRWVSRLRPSLIRMRIVTCSSMRAFATSSEREIFFVCKKKARRSQSCSSTFEKPVSG